MKLLTFAATTSRNSINRKLLTYATEVVREKLGDDLTITTLDLNDLEMPIYSVDREAEGGIPQQAHDFFNAIGEADALLISFAEHNGFYTAAYKNLFDWASRIEVAVYQGKPTVMLSTSTGNGGGANVLKTAVTSGQFFGNEVLGSASLPRFGETFDAETGTITDPELDTAVRDAVLTLAEVSTAG